MKINDVKAGQKFRFSGPTFPANKMTTKDICTRLPRAETQFNNLVPFICDDLALRIHHRKIRRIFYSNPYRDVSLIGKYKRHHRKHQRRKHEQQTMAGDIHHT